MTPVTASTWATSTNPPRTVPRRRPISVGQRADGAQPTDEVVGEDRRRARRGLLALVAPEVGEAARGLGARPVAAPVGPQAARAHQLARGHDDAGVHRGEVGVADPEVVHRPGGHVLDDDVGELGQLVEERPALRLAGVDAEAPLRPARRGERRAPISMPVMTRMKS